MIPTHTPAEGTHRRFGRGRPAPPQRRTRGAGDGVTCRAGRPRWSGCRL